MIYLDYQATTPLAPEAFAAMEPWLKDNFWNPHSAHAGGRRAAAAVELARDQIAALLPKGGRVIFTSGATEAINLAIKGLSIDQLAVGALDHAATLDCASQMRTQCTVQILPSDDQGLINPDDIGDRPGLVAVHWINNEIGTIQPMPELVKHVQGRGGLFLCDAVQGYGKLPTMPDADLIAISAHKVYGPKGIGALWVRDGIKLEPLLHGGGQEQGLRSGTLSPALCAGFGAAALLAAQRMDQDAAHVEALWHHATMLFADWTINGSVAHRLKSNLNIRRDGIDVARLMSECREVMFSAGSACASGSGRPSHVLRAIGLSDAQAKSSIRLGWGRYTTAQDIERAAELINDAAERQLA
jgi:cysteine desulfurase